MKKVIENVFGAMIGGALIVASLGVSIGVAIWSVQWVLRLLGVL